MTAAHPPGVVPAEPGRRGILAVLTLVHAAGSANLMAVLAMGPIVQQALQLTRSLSSLAASLVNVVAMTPAGVTAPEERSSSSF